MDKLKNLKYKKKLPIQKNKNRRKKLINNLAIGCGSFIFLILFVKMGLYPKFRIEMYENRKVLI